MRKAFLIIVLVQFLWLNGKAQIDFDRLYIEAKALSSKNLYAEARVRAREILKMAPEYFDAGVLIARTYAWEQNYDSARFEINRVLQKAPNYTDALSAASDIEYWTGNFPVALDFINKALVQKPDDKDLLLKKVNILMAMGREKEARQILATMLESNPYDYRVNMAIAKMKKLKNRLILEYTFDYFNKPYNHSWNVASLQYQRDATWGTWIGKLNNAYFYNDGESLGNWPEVQIEADAYPKLTSNSYLYLNYGYSWGELFPTHRAGAEYFRSLTKGWEASLGGRYLNFVNGGTEHTFIFTGSVGKYFSNNWLSFRPYLIVNNKNIAQSYYLFYRYYEDNYYNYYGVALGYGYSPDEIMTQQSIITLNNNSYRIRLDVQQLLSEQFLARVMVGNSMEEFQKNKYRYRFDLNIYVAWLF